MDLANIVNQCVQPPLYIHFQFGTQGKTVHALLHTDIGEDRLHNAEAPAVNALPLFTVDLRFHLIDQVGGTALDLNGKIAARGIRILQTARSQRTDGAVFRMGMIEIISTMTVDVVAGMTGQFFSVGAEIHLFGRIKGKVRSSEAT